MALWEELIKLGATIPEAGVAKAIERSGGLMSMAPWLEGNGLLNHQCTRQSSTSRPAFGPVGIEGSVPIVRVAFTSPTFSYKWYGGDLPYDWRVMAAASNIQDAKSEVLADAIQEIKDDLEADIVYGNATTDPNKFNGLDVLFPGSVIGTQDAQVKGAGGDSTNGAALLWTDVDRCWTRLSPAARATAVWLGNDFIDAKIHDLIRSTGQQPQYFMEEFFGGPYLKLKGRPFVLSNHLNATETRGTNSDCSSLWCICTGKKGFHFRYPLGGKTMVQIKELGAVPGNIQEAIRLLAGFTPVVESKLWVSRIAGIRDV